VHRNWFSCNNLTGNEKSTTPAELILEMTEWNLRGLNRLKCHLSRVKEEKETVPIEAV
jgi:hypothetical protein